LPASLAYARRPGDTIAGARGPYPGQYEKNRGLDVNGDGRITLRDLGEQLASAIATRGVNLRAAVRTAYAHRPDDAPWDAPADVIREPEPRGRAGLVLGLAAVLGVGFVVSQRKRREGAAALERRLAVSS
jgi:hypothetical protein